MGGSAMLLVSHDESFLSKINNEININLLKISNITTVIIRKSDGDIIKRFIQDYPSQFSRVNMNIKFESIKTSKKVKIDFVTRSDDYKSYAFVKELFEKFFKEIEIKTLLFEPHYKYSSCKVPEQNLNNTINNSTINTNVSNEEYCTPLNKQNNPNINNSTLILHENVRQKCIWFMFKDTNPVLYWTYMIYFSDWCLKNNRFNLMCSKEVTDYSGINYESVNYCFNTVMNKPNDNMDFIKKDMEFVDKYSKTNIDDSNSYPIIFVNNLKYKVKFKY